MMKAGEMNYATIRYLGQVGVSIRVGGMTVVIDPYLTDAVDRVEGYPPGFWRRNYAPPVLPAGMKGVDLVLVTHDHLDHAEPETLRGIMEASPECHFAGPRLTVKVMIDAGIPRDRTTVLKEGTPFAYGACAVDAVAASHEEYEEDAEGYDRFLGYVVRWGALHVYHAGDTVLTPRLMNALKKWRLDLAFLPINGRNDGRRRLDIVGNMDAAEAMLLARSLAANEGLEIVTPTHYDLYAPNGGKLSDFVREWEETAGPKPKLKAFLPGEEMIYST